MADFEDVEFIENLEETVSTGPQVAPEGDYVCKLWRVPSINLKLVTTRSK